MIPSSTSLQPELPPDTKPLQHQVAGHVFGKSKTKFGILQRCSTGDILKPIVDERGLREEQFYRDVLSLWCNQLACIVLVCTYISVFWKLEDSIYYSSFHPLFLGAYVWHIGCFVLTAYLWDIDWSVLDYVSIDLCHDILHKLIYLPWWSTCSYGWVIARDGPMIFISICALLGVRYVWFIDESTAYQSLTVWYNDSRRDFVPSKYTPGRQWRRRRMDKFHCMIRRFIVVKGIYTERETVQYLRRHLMGRI
ncbi:hypothetical protein I4U23_000229 [Adineta vaga]|nr:hypothetical protein I4U23_000229 [Adineta vaga]